MADYHEPPGELRQEARDYSRVLKSIMEEIEAVDWYNQRVVTAQDEDLRDIVKHNRNEEIEHACMGLEWLRRNRPEWAKRLKTYLFSDQDIVELEQENSGEERAGSSPSKPSLEIGTLGDE